MIGKTTSERIRYIKNELKIKTNVKLGALAGATKAVVGMWLSGEIKTISAEYAFALEESTPFLAKWIMLGEGSERRQATGFVGPPKPPIETQKASKVHAPIKDEDTLAVIAIMEKLSPRSKIVMRTNIEWLYKNELLPDEEKRKAITGSITNFIGRTGTQ